MHRNHDKQQYLDGKHDITQQHAMIYAVLIYSEDDGNKDVDQVGQENQSCHGAPEKDKHSSKSCLVIHGVSIQKDVIIFNKQYHGGQQANHRIIHIPFSTFNL